MLNTFHCTVCASARNELVAMVVSPDNTILMLCDKCDSAGEVLPDFDIPDAPPEIMNYNNSLNVEEEEDY